MKLKKSRHFFPAPKVDYINPIATRGRKKRNYDQNMPDIP